MLFLLEKLAVPIALKLIEIYFSKPKQASADFIRAKERVSGLLEVATTTEERWKAVDELHELQKK